MGVSLFPLRHRPECPQGTKYQQWHWNSKEDSPVCVWWKELRCEFFYFLPDTNLAIPKEQIISNGTRTQKEAKGRLVRLPHLCYLFIHFMGLFNFYEFLIHPLYYSFARLLCENIFFPFSSMAICFNDSFIQLC